MSSLKCWVNNYTMSAKQALNVVLYWHMHQPEYRNLRTGQYHLPWTYLHVIKDYVDMAAHLETVPAARAVVNFTPTLLEQIDDYAKQISSYLQHGTAIHDPLLDALIQPVLPQSGEQRLDLIRQCLRANEERLINRYPEYHRLADMARWLEQHPDSIIYISEQYLADILVWFHLAWLGETVRRSDLRVAQLQKKGAGFNLHDRNELMRIIGDNVSQVIERYKVLAERGQIELSVTPYAHPIMPLMLDINSTHEAMPEAPLPMQTNYPGGKQRVDWHIEQGIKVFEEFFGFRPSGCWPSEGSVSEETVRMLDQHGFKWLASGETVLHNSLHAVPNKDKRNLHNAYQYADTSARCFFRDDGLSDLIGFTYATWHADDAVANFINHLENIAASCENEKDAIVSVILDGENAWEYYPENGYYFLNALYTQLSKHPGINLTTYSDYLQQHPEPRSLQRLVAGSWVYGTFSTWIGEQDKNRAWDMLSEAKQACDTQLASRDFTPQELDRILKQLAICEGSDWFWWFGDYNPSESVSDFDYLYRLQLSNLYMRLCLEPPNYLTEAFSHGGGGEVATGGTMRRGKQTD